MSVGGKVNLFGAKMNLVVPLAIVIVIGAVFLIMMDDDDDDDNGNGNGLCIINCPPEEVPLAIQARCDLGGALSANDITKGEPETAMAFLSINDEAGAIELAKALDEYPWYKLGSGTHGPTDIKGDNLPPSMGGTQIIDSGLRSRYSLGRNVFMPGSSHDALIGMIEGNADNLESLCK